MFNKDSVINQLKNQISTLTYELNKKDEQMESHLKGKKDDLMDFEEQINQITNEKNELLMEKYELIDNLKEATERLKKMKDLITDKYYDIESNLYKEKTKNQNLEKKYKGKLKQMQIKEKELEKEIISFKDIINKKDLERNQIEMNYQKN